MKQFLRFEIKEISAEGSFEGLLSPYGNLDLTGDVVEPGAFTKTLKDHGNTVPMLYQHKTDRPIGELTLEDRPEGLWCKGQLLMALPDAQHAYLLIKARIVKGLSIGYDSVRDAIEGGVRHLKEIRLWEGSVVTFPANLQALITTVKARKETKDDFTEELADIQLQDMGYQIFAALRCALCSLPWASGMTRDEKVTAAGVTIQQFSDAFLAYLPAYIDFLTEEYGDMQTMSQAQIETKRMEHKAGRKISAATKKTLATAHDHMKSATDLLSALLEDEAATEDDSSAGTSAAKAAAPKTEPDPLHSAAQTLITNMRSLIPAA